MPFTRIAMHQGKSPEYRRQLSRLFHETLVAHFGVPADDCFQIIDEYEPGALVFDPHYETGTRSEDFVLFQVTAGRPRTPDQKRALYQALARRLHEELGLAPDDVMVVIQFTQPEDWSFGQGRMFQLGQALTPT